VPKTAEVLASRIRKAIIRGELKAGFKLPVEAALIADFEVSRPTIREAIRILESEGLISVTRGARGGARVNPVNGEMLARAAGVALQANGATIQHIYEMRSIIEPPAARMTAEARNLDAAAALRDCLARERAYMATGKRPTQLIAEFHRILLERCGNIALAVMGAALHDVVAQHLRFSSRTNPGASPAGVLKRLRFGLRSQERLIELIEAGDGPGAEVHWKLHMKAAGEVWLADVAGTAVVDAVD